MWRINLSEHLEMEYFQEIKKGKCIEGVDARRDFYEDEEDSAAFYDGGSDDGGYSDHGERF